MNNSEVLELKKRFKKSDKLTLDRIRGAYVIGSEKRIQAYIDTTYDDLSESEQFKYLDIFKKGLSGVINKNLLNLKFRFDSEDGTNAQRSLLALRDSELKNDDILESFYQLVINNYHAVGNYLILVIQDVYDVMKKTTDNITLDESDERYSYLFCCICPVNLAKPALSYHEAENIIANRERDWVVDMPDNAFLYPSFNERSTDVNEVLYYCKGDEQMHSEFIDAVLCCGEEVTSVKEKEMFTDFIQDVISEAPGYDTFEVVKAINDELVEMEENLTVGEPITFNKQEMKKLLSRSGIKDEHLEIVEEKFDENVGEEGTLRLDSIREKKDFNVKTGNVQIKVKSDEADVVEIRILDGRKCLVIPMNATMEVNGIVKRIVEELTDENN